MVVFVAGFDVVVVVNIDVDVMRNACSGSSCNVPGSFSPSSFTAASTVAHNFMLNFIITGGTTSTSTIMVTVTVTVCDPTAASIRT